MSGARLRILTLNTWKCDGDYRRRLEAMVDWLQSESLDLILLQECFRAADGPWHTARVLSQALNLSLVYAAARAKPREVEGEAVLSESGLALLIRGEAHTVQRLPLPSTPEGGERIALIATIGCRRAPDVRMAVANVHLSHLPQDDAVRELQLQTVLNLPLWRDPSLVGVLGGDFNCDLDSAPLRAARHHPDLSLWPAWSGFPAAPTHPCPPRPGQARRSLDHLFALTQRTEKKWPQWEGTRTAPEQPVRGVWPSDHFAVVADLLPP